MLDYKAVVKERYDKDELNSTTRWNEGLYSFCNPIGFYGDVTCTKIIYDFYNLIKKTEIFKDKRDNMKVLDIGCGMGYKTRAWAEILGQSNKVYGFEYSLNRLEYCKKMNPAIHYEFGNMVEGIPFQEKFTAITAFVVLMHLKEEDEIQRTISNIYDSLEKKGFFLWYECNTKSHFISAENADGNGFSAKEMDRFAEAVGFKLVKQYGVFKSFGGNTTVYWANRLSILTLDFINKFFLGKRGNLVRVYRKEGR